MLGQLTVGTTTKTCTRCASAKPLADFYRQHAGRLGRAAVCKACQKAYYAERWVTHKGRLRPKLAEWKRKNPHKVRASHLRRYGLTSAAYDQLLHRQGNLCAVCDLPFDATKLGRPNIDHDHTTNAVRGVVHGACNLVLGLAKENPAVLERAGQYLRGHGKC